MSSPTCRQRRDEDAETVARLPRSEKGGKENCTSSSYVPPRVFLDSL
jgi:hypothetical protein